jgi:hypothetical protein
MSRNKPRAASKPEVLVHDASTLKGALKAIGGSMSDEWNNVLANQTIQTLWLKNSDTEEIRRQRHATVSRSLLREPIYFPATVPRSAMDV